MLIFVTSCLLGSLIGWITNKLAIKMLFKPVHPIRFLFITIQGVFPKRQAEIAKSLGKIVNAELVGIDDFKSALTTPENIQKVNEKLKVKLEETIQENIPPMFLAMAGGAINSIIEKFTSTENSLLDELIEDLTSANDSIDISKIVEEKVNQMDFRRFEGVLLELMSKELKHIEYIGAFLGLLIGVGQGLLLIITN
jgi:uncharacterized membrane protein YheB (UPF0754 family)